MLDEVDQDQVVRDVAIPVVFSVTGQGVVAVARLQRQVGQQGRQDSVKVGMERGAMLALFLALVVAFELAGVVRCPPSDR